MSIVDDNVNAALADEDLTNPPDNRLAPGPWMKANLFNSRMNGVITVVLAVAITFGLYSGFAWIANEEWAIIRANLRNFMVGRFPKEELWRLWASGYVLLAALGLGGAAMARNARDDAIEKGLPVESSTWLDLLRRFWPIMTFIAIAVSFARTLPPFIGVGGALVVFVAARSIGWAMPVQIRSRALFVLAFGVLLSVAILAGTSGLVAISFAVVLAALAATETGRRLEGNDIGSRVVRALVPFAVIIVAAFAIRAIPFEGFGWEDWGGLHLTLFATTVGIAAGMPLGILLAIGRRSNLPVIKAFCVTFIEIVRGVPLISLLLFSNIILPLLFPPSSGIPETLTRAMIVITLFSAAYIAEIVRGGLQAVPTGQTEAAQASGMSPGKIQRLIVMPQALRAVIPAMVGQFISLFKDTSLLAIIGVAEFFQYSAIANSQPDFLGKSLQLVTYSFVAIGYWSFAYTMSKESRRLEVKLGVGHR